MASPERPVTVAVDLLGGDHAPDTVIEGALLAAADQPDFDVVLVGPPDLAANLLQARGAPGGLRTVAATEVVEMAEDPVRGVRAKRDATVRVAARLVRDGGADAMVSVGATGAALAAALFTLGRTRGMSRPALAVVVPGVRAPYVLLDVGAGVEATPDLLAQFALAGAAYAGARLGVTDPRVALLSNGAEAGKGDALRRDACGVLAALPVQFVGNVEGSDLATGGSADVVVTDGFTGNVALKTLEGTARTLLDRIGAGAADVAASFSADQGGGAVLLGVEGVCVVGHGASRGPAVAATIRLAVDTVRQEIVARTTAALADLLLARRQAGGLPTAAGATP